MSVRSFFAADAANAIEALPVRRRQRAVTVLARALRANARALDAEYQGRHSAECPMREVVDYEAAIEAELARRGANATALNKAGATDFLCFLAYNCDFDEDPSVEGEIRTLQAQAEATLGPRVWIGP